MNRRSGYLLVETIVAMGVLSISAVVMHAGIHQAIIARGQAQDYTTARFVLQSVISKFEMENQFVEGKGDGTYDNDPRFKYTWEIKKMEVPKPPLPDTVDPIRRQDLEKFFTGYMPKITVHVTWNRAGFAFDTVGQTLLGPDKLWQPPPPPPPPPPSNNPQKQPSRNSQRNTTQ